MVTKRFLQLDAYNLGIAEIGEVCNISVPRKNFGKSG